jgi:hypothetical protein
MTTLVFNSHDLKEMEMGEMIACGGGFSFAQMFYNIVGNMIVNHYDEIYESAEATRRTFERHPEIFVK